MVKKIDENTLAILSRVTVAENQIFLTCGQLDRKQYEAVNKVLDSMGGKWNRKSKSHVFTEDPTDRLESVLLTGEITPPKKNGYFPTPKPIVSQLIAWAEVEPGMTVLEPSAGQGSISDELHDMGCLVFMIENLPDNWSVLEKKGKGILLARMDFMEYEPTMQFDRVVMNPPFERQQDIDHVTRAFGFLKPGGLLVSVMASGVMFRENGKTVEFRKLIDDCGWVAAALPEGSLKKSGTNVNTVIVVLQNPNP
jgi:predicted RNA methylase